MASKYVIFVCTGNVCRSPMAEALFRDLAEEAGVDWKIGSAGLGAMDGCEPSSHSVTVMKEEKINICALRSSMLTPEMVQEASHIFGMTRGHCEAIRAYFPSSIEKTFVLREFVVDDEFELDVPDPIGMDLAEYERTRNLIKEAMPSVLNFVNSGDPENFEVNEEDIESENE